MCPLASHTFGMLDDARLDGNAANLPDSPGRARPQQGFAIMSCHHASQVLLQLKPSGP